LIDCPKSRPDKQANLPLVSIIIPTFNRKEKLRNCLESIRKLEYPESLLEIIVVDNGSLDDTIRIVRNEFKEVKLVTESRRGVSFARNTGFRHSKGKIIAFIDDDCQVHRGWLRKIVSDFSCEDLIGVGGPVVLSLDPTQVSLKFLAVFSAFSHYDLGQRRKHVVYLSGANMSFRREAFDFTSFDPNLGPPNAYLEDFDFCETLHRLGFKLLYDPEAIVYHFPDNPKLSLWYILIHRGPKEGFSYYYYDRKRRPWIKVLRYFIGDFLTKTIRLLRHRNGHNFFKTAVSFYGVLACLRKFNVCKNQVNDHVYALNSQIALLGVSKKHQEGVRVCWKPIVQTALPEVCNRLLSLLNCK